MNEKRNLSEELKELGIISIDADTCTTKEDVLKVLDVIKNQIHLDFEELAHISEILRKRSSKA